MEKAEYYEKLFRISAKVLDFARKIIKEDAKILEIAEKIENKIYQLNAKPAWPLNICINEIAAHYTPEENDETRIKSEDLVKVDVGIHIDGYIIDSAFTVCLADENNKLIEASEIALENALKIVKPGIKVKEISEKIYSSLKELNVKPIINLCGHSIERYVTHAGITIPNVPNNIQTKIEKGDVIAIEVFTTSGSGWVEESYPPNIFAFLEKRGVRMPEARKILELAEKKFEKLPFAKRWIKDMAKGKVDIAISKLVEIKALRDYPPLKESFGKVAVSEKTILVE